MIPSMTRRSATRVAVAAAVLIVAAGCTKAGDGANTGPIQATSEHGQSALEAVNALYSGDFDPVPSDGPTAVPGANVWYISCGQAYEFCSTSATAFEEAGRILQWNVTVVDGKAEPNTAATAIRQAIAARADAIVLQSFDCPGIRNALTEARGAGVPTIASQSADCDVDEVGGSPEYTARTTLHGDNTSLEFYEQWGAAKANYIIARTDARAKVIELSNTDQLQHIHQSTGFERELATCDTCELTERLEFSFSDVANGVLAQRLQSALLEHPDVNAVFVPFDALFGLGVSNALNQSGRRDLITIGGEGFVSNLEAIRDGRQTASMPIDTGWIAYAAADTTNRILAGQSPADLPNEGLGYQLIDASNVDTQGTSYAAPIDFRTDFTRLWTGAQQ